VRFLLSSATTVLVGSAVAGVAVLAILAVSEAVFALQEERAGITRREP
jgi:hypothetical protein